VIRLVVLACVLAVLCDPAAAEASWKSRVEAALRAGRYAEAAATAARAHAAAGDPASAAWAGVSLALAGQPSRARPWLLRAAKLDPGGRTGAVARAWLVSAGTYDARKESLIRHLAASTNPRLTAAQATWVARAVLFSAWMHGIDPLLLAAVVHVESGWNHAARSPAGALGLAQLMPITARGIGVDPRHPLHNLMGAARLLRGHLDSFRWAPDPLEAALSAYNAGSGVTRRAGGRPPYASTARYVRAVVTLYLHLVQQAI
jgi:soluble lytic murein transglycosylase-like protein